MAHKGREREREEERKAVECVWLVGLEGLNGYRERE